MTATDFIAVAKERRAVADRRVAELTAELAIAQHDLTEWDIAIARATSLANGIVSLGANEAAHHGNSVALRIRAASLAGIAAKVLLENGGSMSMADLASALSKLGHGTGENFRSTLNTALWRRKDDLFDKDVQGVVALRTRDIVFTGEGDAN